jgi:hypothetical protein
LRFVLALASVAILLLQGSLASAAALACMKACEAKGAASCQASQPSCHGGGRKADKAQEHDCDGACGSICSTDKSKATSIEGLSFKVPSFEIAAVVPEPVKCVVGIPEAAPELHETDSSPPRTAPDSTHSLRAPPTRRA